MPLPGIMARPSTVMAQTLNMFATVHSLGPYAEFKRARCERKKELPSPDPLLRGSTLLGFDVQ
jgi:hypothetical protein